MDPHRTSFPNPPANTRYPPPFYPPPNPHHHHNHQHHHLPPPPRLPPPPHLPHQSPISLPPPPPLPNSYHHHHHGHGSHQFPNPPHRGRLQQQPLDPNLTPHHHRNHSHNLNNRLDFSQPPPRVTDRLVYDDDRRDRPPPPSRGFDADPFRRPIDGPSAWNPPPRVPIDAPPPPPPRRIPRGSFDREPPPYHPSFQPVDRFRNNQEGGSRVRKEFDSDNWFRADEFPRERRDNFMNNDNFHRDRRFERDIDRDIRRNEFVSTSVDQFCDSVPQEEPIRKGRGDVIDENLRWDHFPRGAPHSPTPPDLRSREIDGGNGFYEKGKTHVLDSDRLGDRDRWEDAQEFDLTPRKKQKRKNALLRLQPGLPSFRNGHERSPSSCRDREPSQVPDNRPIKERERSPIVSFKSNLLIVASSSSGAVADDFSALGDGKNRNEVMDNKADLVTPRDFVEKVPLKIDSDSHCGNGPCTLGEQEMHLAKKTKTPTNPKKVKPSVSHDSPVANAEAPSNKTECLSVDKTSSKPPNGKVLAKSNVATSSGKESSPNFRNKRKVLNPHSSISRSPVLKKDSEPVSVDNLVNSSSPQSMLYEGLKDSGKPGKVLSSAVMITEPTEVTATGSSKTSDEKRAVDSASVGTSVPKRRRKIVKPRPGSSRQLSGKSDEIPVNVIGPIQGGQTTSNFDGSVDEIQKGSSLDVVVNDSGIMDLDVVSVPHEQGFAEGSSGDTPSVKRFIPFQISTRPRTTQSRTTKFDIIKIGCANVLSASDSTNSSERQLSCSKSRGTESALSSGGVSAARHKKVNFSEIVKVVSQSQTSSSKNGALEEYTNTKPSEQDGKGTIVSSSEELHISEIPYVSCCNEAITLSTHNAVSMISEQLVNCSDACIVNDASKLSCMDRLSASIEVGVSGGFPESETMETDLSLFPAEGSLTKNDRKRKGSVLQRGSGKIYADGVNLTLGRSIDSDLVQDKITGSGFTSPDAQLKLCVGDRISMNGSKKISYQETGISVDPCAYPSEVITSTCNKKIKVGSAHTTTPVICEKTAYSDALPCDADVPPESKGLNLSHPNGGSALVSADLKLVEEACGKESSNFVLPGAANVSDIPDRKQASSLLESVSLPQGDRTLLMTGAVDGYWGAVIESGSERSICNRSVTGDSSSQNQCSDQNISQPEPSIVNADNEPAARDLECDINIPVKGDLSSRSKSSPMTDNVPLVDSPETLPATASLEVVDVPNLNGKPVVKKTNGKSTLESGLISSNSSTSNNIVNFKMAKDGTANSSVKTMPFITASQSAKEVLQSSSNERKKQTIIKNERNFASSKALSSRSSFVPSSGRGHTTAIKSRTWHRTDNPTFNPTGPSNPPGQNSSTRFVPRQNQVFSQTTRVQSNSYVRKGNSLLRNPVTATSQPPSTSAPATSGVQLNLSASVDAKNIPCEIPEKVTSPCNIDSSNCDLVIEDSRCSPVSDSSVAADNGSQRFPEDMHKFPVNSEFQPSISLEDQSSLNDINHSRRMVYIKHKSNQLVAAPNSSTGMSVPSKELPALTSDVYFKRKKNQLVRATAESHSRQTSADPNDGSISEGRRVVKSYVRRSATKKYPNRVSQKIPKSRNFSLVWKLCNTRSPKKGVNSVRCQQVLPHLLPWKRAAYWRSLFGTSADHLKNSPLSHKLASSRKRHIIYKRSGFSLRRSKVVSLAGSSLKRSISLERRSMKVDKEAKLAVAALEIGKRVKNGVPNSAGIESKNNSLYEEHSASGTGHQVKNAFKLSTPSRRLIGNDEYVRIGNGNKLIRNPKRRTRIIASEKVRWSLHTARMRLAKKRKYCQFFTRFGKCNKEEGKCPYIHDPSKNAVCTKFLNGLCSDPKCKLTHKVIPERMPDCSFFLQGTCSNESCPYRHVSVNPKAAICGNFLKGYCAEGNECRKKHSYSCPVYEATGECPEGSRCKLYHPRKGKDKKGKNTRERRNTHSSGRYFGFRPATGYTEPESEGSGKRLVPEDDSIILEDGSLADYISLDASDEDDGDQEDEASQEINLSSGEQPSFVSDDPDELIKPIRLLRIMSQAAEGRVLNE